MVGTFGIKITQPFIFNFVRECLAFLSSYFVETNVLVLSTYYMHFLNHNEAQMQIPHFKMIVD